MSRITNTINRTKRLTREVTISKINRNKLINRDFSLLSSNCNGAFILHELGLQF